jgi:DNA-directed RNA polymerase specialized sigma24 family protein
VGTPAAWARLCRRRRSRIRSWFGARVAAGQDADDLTEEVLLSLAKMGRPENLDAYITAAMINALARYRRRRAREQAFLRGLLWEVDGSGAAERAR